MILSRQLERTGVTVAMASFTDAHAHTTQPRALTLGSLLIVVCAKETEDGPIV